MRRQTGDDKFYRCCEVEKGVAETFPNASRWGVRTDLLVLTSMGFLELQKMDLKTEWRDWTRKYRLKEEYV